MRIEEQTKSGFFWLPSNPERTYPGTLKIYDGGKIELELIGPSPRDNLSLDVMRAKNPDSNTFSMSLNLLEIPRIFGLIDNDIVTLDKCFTSESFGFSIPGTSKTTVYATRAFMKVWFDENAPININKMVFSIDGLDEWVGKTGISVSLIPDLGITTFNYKPINEPFFILKNGMKIRVIFSYSTSSMPSLTEAKLTQKAYLELSSEDGRLFDDFISVAEKIATFVAFGSDESVSIQDVTIASNSIAQEIGSGKMHPIQMKCFYSSSSYTKYIPKIDRHHMLFIYSQISNDMENIINNWLSNYELVEPAMNLYFSFKKEDHAYLEGKFLALAQGLETYHRRKTTETLRPPKEYESITTILLESCPEHEREWLKNILEQGNQISFRKRLKKTIEPFKNYFGNCNQRDELIGKIYDTRNYLTHYDKKLESKAAKGQELWRLCCRMEAIFKFNFLNDLGFSVVQITSIHENSIQTLLRN